MEKIFVVLDTSGSMSEEEKKSILVYTIYSLEGLMENDFFNVKYEFFQWGKNIDKLDTINKMSFGEDLNETIEDFFKDVVDTKFLFITDGNFQRSLINKMKNFINNNKFNSCVIALGYDCNIATLRTIFKRENVYNPYDIATCIRNLLNN